MNTNVFSHIPREQWNDWTWQFRNRIMTAEELSKYLKLTDSEREGIDKCLTSYRMAITPYYLSLIDPDDPFDPIRRQAVPSAEELYFAPEDQRDPLHEETDSPCTGLTHRYPDRVLLPPLHPQTLRRPGGHRPHQERDRRQHRIHPLPSRGPGRAALRRRPPDPFR